MEIHIKENIMSNLSKIHINITHGEDFDGLASQVLIRRHLREQGFSDCEFYRIKYGSMQELLEKLSKRNLAKTHYVISDVNLMDKLVPVLEVLEGKRSSNSLDFYDHHQFSRQKQGELSRLLNVNCYIGPDEKCTTILIQEHLFPRDPNAIFLAQEANHSDLKDPGQSPENRLLGRLIAMKATANFEDPDIEKIASIISKPNFFSDPWLRSLMADNERVCQVDLQTMLDSADT